MRTFADFKIQMPHGARGDVKVLCPECSAGRSREHQRDRCLSVNVEEGIWLCHHCGWTGTLWERDAPMLRPVPRAKPAAPPVQPEKPENAEIGPRGFEWFAARGIPAETVRAFGIYTERRYFADAGDTLPALVFPYLLGGAFVNAKYRAATGKQFTMTKGARKTFFNLDAVRDVDAVVIVEGECDVLACAVAGVKAISVPNGANSLTDEVMDSARFLMDRAARRFVLAVDADEPGRKLEAELARRFGRERCARVSWPEGCKDANEVLTAHGAAAIRAAVDAAAPYPVEGIVYALDVEEEVWGLYADGLPSGTDTGWAGLRGLYSVRPGELTVVTGIPGSGKSAFVDNLTVNLARDHGWRFAMYSPENHPVARHLAGLLGKYVHAPFADGVTPRMRADEVDAGVRWINERYAFILPEEPTLDAVLDRARILVYRMGVRGLVIDPWNEMDHSRPPAMTETEYVSRSLTRIRQFARHNDVHVWLVAHPTKLIKAADGQYPVPTPYDISGSAHFYNKADNCLSIWRDKSDDRKPTDVHTQKIRFPEVGSLGIAQLRYRFAAGYFEDVTLPASAFGGVA